MYVASHITSFRRTKLKTLVNEKTNHKSSSVKYYIFSVSKYVYYNNVIAIFLFMLAVGKIELVNKVSKQFSELLYSD